MTEYNHDDILYSLNFNQEIPIQFRAQTLTQAIIDKIQYILEKMSQNQILNAQDLYDLENFTQILKDLMVASPKDFSTVEQEYITTLSATTTKLANHPKSTSSKSLIMVEASAQTLLYQLQKSA